MKTEILAGSVMQRNGQVVFSRLDQELLAIDAQAGECFSLSETAGRAWELLREPMSVDAVCAQLCREYAVDEARCLQQIIALLDSLHAAGLVRVCHA